jgi:hypothetical protein
MFVVCCLVSRKEMEKGPEDGFVEVSAQGIVAKELHHERRAPDEWLKPDPKTWASRPLSRPLQVRKKIRTVNSYAEYRPPKFRDVRNRRR